MKNSPSLIGFLRSLYESWITDRPGQMAAAITYFGLFSIAPIIFIGYTISSLVIKQVASYSLLYVRLENALGSEAAKMIQDSVDALGEKTFGGSALVSVVSFLALLFAASGMFFQIQFALNTIFKVPPATRNQTRAFILQRLVSFIMVIGIGFLAILATLINIVVVWFGSIIGNLTGAGAAMIAIDKLSLFGLLALAFALIYKFLPDAHLAWRDVWSGAAVAALLALLAGWLLGIYFRFGGVGSAFEAAGTFAVVLVAVNIFAQIFLFGALFTREFALKYGSKKNMVEKTAA